MAALKPGDTFPTDVVFKYVFLIINYSPQSHIAPPPSVLRLNGCCRYIPWTEESDDITACGIPINYDASKEWANKKVVLFSVPGMLSMFPQPQRKAEDILQYCTTSPLTRHGTKLRRLHPHLLRQPCPWLHSEPAQAPREGRRYCCCSRFQ